jgi:Flp pilus assembly pilin Flp
MFRKLLKNKKAQNTAEYALLISLVVAAIIAMQTYAQRSLQARIRDAGNYLVQQTTALGATAQYEPYYLLTNYQVTRDSSEVERLDNNLVSRNINSLRTRAQGGTQISNYVGLVTSP